MNRFTALLIALALIAGTAGCPAEPAPDPGPPVRYELTIASTEGGSVTTPGEGAFTRDAGTVVSLVTSPDSGYRFVNWTGDVGTVADPEAVETTITMNGNYSITANFEEMPSSVLGTDLEVAYIERTPKYPRYDVVYIIGHRFTDDFIPYKVDIATGLGSGQTSETKRWPDEGEMVTFTAHILNRGVNTVEQFEYEWLLDGNLLAASIYTSSILPGERATISVEWPWSMARHRIKFIATVDEDVTPSNNSLEDYTDALGLRALIDQSYDNLFMVNSAHVSRPFTSSSVEWLQLHMKKLNQMLEEAGALTRVRWDSVEIIGDDAPLPSWEETLVYDGFFPNHPPYRFTQGGDDPRLNGFPFYDPNEGIAYGWLHEIGHQLGLIDIYQLNVEPFENEVNTEGYRATHCLMNTCAHIISEHSAMALNSWHGKRRGYFGQYLYDIPEQNYIRFLEADGSPLTEASVAVYQRTVIDGVGARIPNIPKFQGVTDADGIYALPNVPVEASLFAQTETGNELRPNPFGYISNHGANGVFLLKIEKNEFVDYQWIDITYFNLAYWGGQTEDATYQIKTRLSSKVETELPSELTEGNADNWLAKAVDGTLTTVEDDYSLRQIGEASIKLVTESCHHDVSVRYPGLTMGSWDLSGKSYFTISFYAENPNIGFRANSPWIRLGNLKTEGYIQYQADWDVLNDCRGQWRNYSIPFAGDDIWNRTTVGAVDLNEIHYIEIQAATWDCGFTLWIDGLSFG